MSDLRSTLEPIAEWFNQFNLPEPITHWGHPVMMATVVFAMGSAAAWTGWRSRTLATENVTGNSEAGEAVVKNKADHRKIAPLMYLFLVLGYTGGVLSLVMQGQPILESPHFVTGTVVIGLLTVNAVLAATGFIGNKETLRTIHAYVGSLALFILIAHAALGLKLGLSI